MPLLGKAAVAMWWTIEPAMRSEFADWHSHEHFPERMRIPGFRRGSRWVAAGAPADFFVLYELAEYGTLTSPGYLDRLNDPTPWSTKMMPHHRNMVRSQARVMASYGGGIGACLATIRLSPSPGAADALAASLRDKLRGLAEVPGLTGGHLLVTQTPATAARTTEQKIRGADGAADWIVIVAGYDPARVASVLDGELDSTGLGRMGAAGGTLATTHTLSYCLTTSDLPDPEAAPAI